MFNKLKHITFGINRFYVLGISVNNDVSEYCLLEIELKNNDLQIENRHHFNTQKDSLLKYLKKDYPIILHIEGDNIISKALENKIGYQNNLIFKSNPEEFHFYEYHQDDEIYLSVIRKNHVQEIINTLTEINHFVVHLTFGPFVLVNVIESVKEHSEICSTNYCINTNNTKIVSFKINDENGKDYDISGEKLNQREIPLLASFLDYKYHNQNVKCDTNFLKEYRNESNYKKWFKMAGVFTLSFILIALFISHNLQNHYVNSLAEKQSIQVMSQQTLAQFNSLKNEKDLKEKILLSSGISNKSFITKYISDIGNSVLNDINLISINVNPPLKKIRLNEKINFGLGIINVEGETQSDASFNDWIKQLKALPWIKKIDINYEQDNKTVNTFKLKISL